MVPVYREIEKSAEGVSSVVYFVCVRRVIDGVVVVVVWWRKRNRIKDGRGSLDISVVDVWW